jgi:hypothetical protein
MVRKQVPQIVLIILMLTMRVPYANAGTSPLKGYYTTYEIVLTDIIRNGGANLYRLVDEDRMIHLFMNDSWQTVYLVATSYPVQNKTYDFDENKIAYLHGMPLYLHPNELIVVNATYHAQVQAKEKPQLDENLSGSLSEIPQELKRDYCQPIGPWQFNRTSWKYLSTIVNATAQNEDNVLRILYSFVEWIGKNVGSPSKERFRPFYPNETYSQLNFEQGTHGEGDCDDQANLLITLCRIVGIPAYLQIGCLYLPTEQYASRKHSDLEGHLSIEERHIGFHGWAMVYIPPWGWMPVDMTWGYDQSKGPSSAVTNSALMTVNAIAMLNIIRTDYVLEDEEWSKNLIDSNLYVAEIYSMTSLLVKPEYGQLPLGDLLPSGFGIILVTIVVLSLYVVARRRKFRYQQTAVAEVYMSYSHP